MSALDIAQLAALLSSTKAKDKNDALLQLEAITSSRWRLASKQLRVLTGAIFQLIENESQQFTSNKYAAQATTISRLNKASYFLRILIEKAISDRLNIRSKFFLEICFSIKNSFYVQGQPLDPCLVDFVMILAAVLGVGYVNEHISSKEWQNIYDFLVTATSRALDDGTQTKQFGFTNEKVLIGLWTALHNLLRCETSSSCTELFENDAYFKFLPLLNKTIDAFRKEHPIQIVVFRILNKLIILLATTDVKFAHKLIELGIKLTSFCRKTRWEKLQDQYLIFLNLQSTHNLMYIDSLPKLTGDSEIQMSFLSEESVETQVGLENSPSVVHNMELLIVDLINYLLALPSDLCGSVGLFDFNSKIDWFNLRTIRFKGEDRRRWLYTTAVVKLLKTYFEVKKSISLSQGTSTPGKSYFTDFVLSNLVGSFNMIDFCTSLVSYNSTTEFHILSLTLMTFYQELGQTSGPIKGGKQCGESISASYETNTTFDFTISVGCQSSDLPGYLQHMLKTVEYQDAHYWLMMFARSVLNQVDFHVYNSAIRYNVLRQIFKLALDGINKADNDVACDLISKLVSRGGFKLSKIVDDGIRTQLESIIDSPGVNGPSIHDESFTFWYAVNKLCIDLNIKRKNVLVMKIDEWLCEKWDAALSTGMLVQCNPSDFVYWLSGCIPQIGPKLNVDHKNAYEGSFKMTMNLEGSRLSLESFVTLQQNDEETEGHSFAVTAVCSEPSSNFWNQIVSTFSKLNTEPIAYGQLFKWLIALSDILLKTPRLSSQQELWDTLNYQITVGLGAFSTGYLTFEDAFEVMNMIVDYSTESATSTRSFLSRVPFDKLIDSVISSFQIPSRRNKRLFSEEDTEFSEVREESSVTSDASNETSSLDYQDCLSLPVFNLMKFKYLHLSFSKDNEMEGLPQLIAFIENFANENLLVALLYIVDERLPKLSCIDQKQCLIKLLRILGERILSDQVLERNETVLIIVSRMLSHLLPLLSSVADDALYRDCCDIVQWLYALGTKNYITTEVSVVNFTKFLVIYLQHNNEDYIPQTLLEEETFLKFSKSTNFMKSKLVHAFSKYIQSCESFKQMEIYSKLFNNFVTPQSSVENGATYVYFFSILAASSSVVLRMAMFNLTECSKFTFFVPYLKLGFEELYLRCSFSSSRKFFDVLKVDLLRRWWVFDSIKTFPFFLFNYDSLSAFLSENYREIAAVIVSTKSRTETDFRTQNRSMELLSVIADVRNTDVHILISESLSLIFPLSYTKDGIKNYVFDLLSSFVPRFRQEVKSQLPLLILDIVKRLDVSNEVEIATLLPRSYGVSFMIDQASSKTESNNSEVVVPLHSGLQLINKMVEKYHTEDSFFWSTAMIYFLLRRVGTSLRENLASKSTILEIRRIKLIIAMGEDNAFSTHILNLLVETLTPLINDKVLSPVVYRIFTLFGDVFSVENEHFEIFKTISPLLNSLLMAPRTVDNSLHQELVSKLRKYADVIQGRGETSSRKKLITAAIKQLKNEQSTLQVSEIEEFLSEKVDFNAISIVSKLFPYVVDPEALSTRVPMLKNILALGNEQLSQLSEQFKLWVAKCLSKYYFQTPTSNLLDLVDITEYEGPSESELNVGSTFFDLPMQHLVQYAQEGDYFEAACAESVLGVFFNIKKKDPSTLSYVVNLESVYTSMSLFIQDLRLHSCVLLNDEPGENIGDVSLDDLVGNLDSIFHSNKINWCPKIYLALLKDVATYSVVGSIMSIFVVKVPEFASKTISSLVCFYINLSKSRAENMIAKLLNNFANSQHRNKDAIRTFVEILVSVRIAAKTSTNPSFARVCENVDTLRYYELATESRMYKSALMLFEDVFCTARSSQLLESQYSTLQTVYDGLDDIDLNYGLPEKTTLDSFLNSKFRADASHVQFQYSSGCLDASLKLNAPLVNGFSSMMTDAGMLGISSIIGKSVEQTISENDSYEWNWKLSKWDQPLPVEEHSEHQSIYKVLKQIHDFPQNGERICRDNLLKLMDVHTRGGNTGVKEIRGNFLNWLKSLASVTAIEDTINCTSLSSVDEEFLEFEKLENIILARQTSYQVLAENPYSQTSSDSLWSLSLKELVMYNNLARINNEQQKMVSSTVLIDSICKKLQNTQGAPHQNLKHLSMFQLAQSMWKQGITNVPVSILKELYSAGGVDIYDHELKVDKFMIKAMMIEWMSESRQELSSNLMENHVLPTAEMSLRLDDQVQQSKIFRLLAQFCETQFKSKSLSEQIEVLEKRVSEKENEIGELRTHYSSSQVSSDEKRSINKYYSKLKLQYKAECADLEHARANKKRFAVKAIEYYLLTMTMSDFPEEDLDKFCALWLEQSNHDGLNDKIGSKVMLLPSYKLLSWSAQLISRLTKEDTNFQNILKRLIFQVCVDHPYHTLYLLFSLMRHKQLAQKDANPLLLSKAMAAEALWVKLINHNSSSLLEKINEIQTFSEECIRLAEFKAPKGKKINLESLSEYSTFWLHHLPRIPPPTMSLKIDPTKSYSNIPVIWKIERKISTATTGLSLPKIATFILSDGSKHVMLMKHGTDDLRQDSIMEQVFGKVQNFFTRDKECSKRGLVIRTYNAVPLGPRSGVIEFVPNSTSFSDAIQPYHTKHDKMKLEKARDIMRQCQNQDKIERLREYQKIEAKIKPVLHLFFQDCFLTPDRWFESRVKYTHGVATSSIVGHILGLGDRHCNNILLDKRNGEPIHIDLGVAFDQGKQLAIPETVPFRLTRDVVDGFGATGVEGTFKISCQHTMRVLRENRDHIISILDVLRWDPLYSWTLSPIRRKRLQQEEERSGLQPEQDGSDAGRAVLDVSDKLVANGLSTEAVVRELIQEATSPQNLALLYFGWSPFY
ncbi:TEL1 [Candida theae]|uniref:Serine/threonine-protein kinase Tel1 n=1 Tax=Candida theae TaxID=1198502 RepID=A0AAD5BBT5_9ASCO|nr:TEL1 [Candida theae]KAI5952922.1 TEL1 [Candida theae]